MSGSTYRRLLGLLGVLGLASSTAVCGGGPATEAPSASQPGVPGAESLTVGEGTSMALALSPDGRTIVVDLQGSLWSLPVGGGAARRLIDEYYDARQPTWSPDGRFIAFQAYRDGAWNIWTVAPDGSGPTAVTTGPFDDREPHWSPDGARIAFSSDRSGNYDIWEITLATGRLRQVTTNAAHEIQPAWSPDGREIAYASNREPASGVFATAADGTERQVAAAEGNVGAPSWSPDGSAVAYSVTGGGESRLMVGDRRLTADEDVFPFRAAWISATEILYTADGRIKRRTLAGEGPQDVPFTATLDVRPARYTRRRPTFDATEPQPALGLLRPALSPDGSELAFGALGDIWVMRLGDKPQRLTDDAFVDTDPAWSPDGTRIVFSSDRAGGMDLWIRDRRTGRDRRLTEMPDAEMAAAWSPDGRRLAFVSNASFEQGEVYVVDAAGGQPRKLADRSFGVGYPTWSPDGRFVIVSTLKPYSSRFREGMNYLTAIQVDDGTARLIVPVEHKPVGKRAGDGPVWSPDGKHLAYVSEGYLHVLPVGPTGEPTGQPRQVTQELADSISWTGDSRQVLYLATDRLKLVSIETGATTDVPVDLTWSRINPTGRMVVHAGRLADGKGAVAQSDVDVVIEGHRIAAVEPHRQALHTSGLLVDATGLTVMPGLIEAHGHLHKEHGTRFGRIHLAYGITSVRSPGGHPYESLEDREAIDGGRRIGPRIFLTGYLLDGWRVYYPLASGLPSETHLQLEMDRARRLGYDLIKTYVRLPDLLQLRAIELAHGMGLPVSSHEIYPAALSGVDSVEHTGATSRRGYSPKQSSTGRMYEDVIQIIAKSRMTITPTAALGGFQRMLSADPTTLDDPRTRTLFPPWVTAGLRPQQGGRGGFGGPQAAQRSSANILALHKAGARIVAGTDAPLVPYGLALHSELEAYVEAGLTPFEALQTATVNTAALLGASDDLGTIEPGKLADLVMVEGNPLVDIRSARRVRRVIKNGELIDLKAVLELDGSRGSQTARP